MDIELKYKKYLAKFTVSHYFYISPIFIAVLLFYSYSDVYFIKYPHFACARIPLILLLSTMYFVRIRKLYHLNNLISTLSVLTVYAVMFMGTYIMVGSMHSDLGYRTSVSGLIVEIFTLFFLVKGKKNIIIAFVVPFAVITLYLTFILKLDFIYARELINPTAIYLAIFSMALLFENNRKREFILKEDLQTEKAYSDKLYIETLDQNKELEAQKEELQQQKEEILSINDTLEQQKEELQVNLEVISELNGTLNQKNKAITDSINYARRIQEAILPSREYISKLFKNSFILFKPCDIVSGDFYWFKETPNYKIVAAVDCTGHGIPGAFMSMLGYSLLNEITQYGNIDSASEILNQLKIKLKEALNQSNEIGELSDGLDIALCMIGAENNTLQFAGAYMPLCIIRDNAVIDIKGDKMPIGRYVKEIDSFTNHEIEIFNSDVFYLYSDGYQDQIGGEDKKRFLSHNFRKLLLKIHAEPFEKQKNILDRTFENWRSDVGQVDDILVVGFKA